jgi:hypothetical protein
MFKYYKRNIQNILFKFFFIIILIILFSCQKKVSGNINNISLENINIKINGIELFNTDYQIIDYSGEEKEIYMSERILIIGTHLDIKIINKNKINQIKRLINPIIDLEINNKKYLVEGFYYRAEDMPLFCHYNVDENGKIMFYKNNIIKIWGFDEE